MGFYMKAILTMGVCAVLLFSTGCATKKKVGVDGAKKGDFLEAVKQPGYSVNLIKKDIPEHLKELDVVYQTPVSCTEYQQELVLLDELLGEDPIDKVDADNDTITLHIGQILGKQVSSSIPFNSLIESLSGAKKHEKKRLSALVKGQARRSFLKGWAQGKECMQVSESDVSN